MNCLQILSLFDPNLGIHPALTAANRVTHDRDDRFGVGAISPPDLFGVPPTVFFLAPP
jgi:hypothetical protein